MKVISVSTIGNLISAHMEGDNEKFLIFANFIADAYEEAGEVRCARIIRKRIDGTYKNDSTVTLDYWKGRYCRNKSVGWLKDIWLLMMNPSIKEEQKIWYEA